MFNSHAVALESVSCSDLHECSLCGEVLVESLHGLAEVASGRLHCC